MFNGGFHLVVSRCLFQTHGQIDYRNVERRNAERHTGQFACQRGDYLAYGLGCTRRRGDDVADRRTAAAPVLHRRTIYGLLRSGSRMYGSHQTFDDAELVVDDLGQRSQAVGRARCVRYDILACVGIGVHAAYEHRGIVFRGGRHNDVFGTGCNVGLGLLLGQEQTGRLYDILGADFVPLQVCGILLGGYADDVAVDDELALLHVVVDRTVETAVYRVVLEHVSHVVYRNEVIDTYNLNVCIVACSAEYQTADTTETVDTYFDL